MTEKVACPQCHRVRGVRWRERVGGYICGLCGHKWTPENAIGDDSSPVSSPDEPKVPAAPSLNGAAFPCRTCGLSHRNTVHRNKAQFGYHEWVEVPE